MKTVVELIIPIEPLYHRTGYDEPRKGEYLAEAIRSMVGVSPRCNFFNDELRIEFTIPQFSSIKGFYGRRWRSNVTHEVKRHCEMNGYSPSLRRMKIVQS